MADEEKSPDVVLEIDKDDVERRSLEKTLEASFRLQNPLNEKLLANEKLSGISRMTDTLRMLEENAGMRRFADDALRISEVSSAKQLHDHIRLFSENSGIGQFSEKMRLFDGISSAKQLAESLDVTGALARTAMGPMWELRDAGLLGLSGRRDMDAIRLAVEGFEARFRLPEISEMAHLAKLFSSENSLSSIAARYAQEESSIARAIEGMNTAWLDIHDKLHSIAGFAEMQGIGHALRNLQGFDEHLSATLRAGLGDWRDTITWRPDVLDDFEKRSEFYLGLGFNPSLTDFPLPAFEQSLDLAGLRQELPPLIEQYGPPIPLAGGDDEEGLARTNVAHDWLQRLERLLRRFIDQHMTRAVGGDWPKHRLPNGFYDRWQEKKRIAREAGATDLPLIAYADFTDYTPLICRDDNWREIFAPVFKRKESVRESFQRLYPIRLDTAHARLITQDDELLLYVEVKRLWAAIGKWRN